MTTYRMGYSLIPPVIKTLLIANGVMFLAELISRGTLMYWLALWPLSLSYVSPVPGGGNQFWPWQLITYAFLHGGVWHLALNMYALWVFGTRLEDAWGSKVFAFYYFTCVIAAALVQLVVAGVAAQQGMVYPTIGASGGVFGLLLAFGLSYPDEIVMLVFPPVALKAKWFVLVYGAIELWAGVTGTVAGVAHFAHLGGMLAGYLLLRYWGGHPTTHRWLIMRLTEQGLWRRHLFQKQSAGNRGGHGPLFNFKCLDSTIQINTSGGVEPP